MNIILNIICFAILFFNSDIIYIIMYLGGQKINNEWTVANG